MIGGHYALRGATNRLMLALCLLATLLSVGVLVIILGFVLVNGIGAISLDFFTELPRPAGRPGGGVANSIVGTLILIAIASFFAMPIGVGAGIYLAEIARPRVAGVIRFVLDVLTGVPSIVVAIFAFALVVRRMGHFSALAGGIALAVIMIPIVAITTQEALALVPQSLREAAWALGIRRWRTTVSVVLQVARRIIVTGALLAVARGAGETAPLLFTAFGNPHWNTNTLEPIASLPQTIYVYGISPYDDWHEKAWASSLVLVIVVMGLSLAVRTVLGRRPRS